MYKILIAIIIVIGLAGCSSQTQNQTIPPNLSAAPSIERSYNFDISFDWESSIIATDEATARNEIKKQFKDTYGFKIADELIILTSVTN